MANLYRPSLIAELSSVLDFSSVEKANQYYHYLRTALDKHAPPSLRKVRNHNSSLRFELIRDEHIKARRERRRAERKWSNTKLTIIKDLRRQAKQGFKTWAHWKWKCVIFKCYSSEKLITLNTLHEVVPTWYSFHSWVDWSNADKVSCSRIKHIDAGVRTVYLLYPKSTF